MWVRVGFRESPVPLPPHPWGLCSPWPRFSPVVCGHARVPEILQGAPEPKATFVRPSDVLRPLRSFPHECRKGLPKRRRSSENPAAFY